MNYIKEIMKWNETAGNKDNFNYFLESAMLAEENAETIIAMKSGDDIELIDWVIDSFIVGIGSLYKKWFTEEQINRCFEEIIRSNNSKFLNGECQKIDGKIIKPKTFSPANLEKALWDLV